MAKVKVEFECGNAPFTHIESELIQHREGVPERAMANEAKLLNSECNSVGTARWVP